LQSALKSTKII